MQNDNIETINSCLKPEFHREPQVGEISRGIFLGKPADKRYYIFTACPICGFTRWVGKPSIPITNGRCHQCYHKAQEGAWRTNCSHRKGKSKAGYIFVKLQPSDPFYCMTDTEGYVFEHRLIVAKHLGRPLTNEEIVHHKNGIRDDNQLENLELMSSAKEHSIISAQCRGCSLRKEIQLLKWQIKEQNITLKQLETNLQNKLHAQIGGSNDTTR